MININQTSKILALVVIAVFFGLILFNGCTEEKKVVETVVEVQHDTVFVSIIAVDAINASMDSVTQGLPITLTVQITKGSQVGTLAISWSADGGHFDKTTGDTVTWTSPDDPGVYTITVNANDGTYSGVGTRLVGVGMYVPTTTPFYLGVDACAGCHAGGSGGNQFPGWSETGHAHAWEDLQNSGHARESCNHCHTVDFNETPGNSGFDDAPIAKYENVQCENCHGAGSDHIAGGNPDPTKITINYEATLCGDCHTGARYPQFDEWQLSLHGNSLENHAVGISSCLGCHEGVAGEIRLDGDLSSFYGSGSVARPDTSEYALADIGCATCHDPHSVDNEHQVRTVDDVVLFPTGGVSPVISEGGLGKLCMQCHHARHGADDNIPNGNSHFGPHASTQADILAAETGYKGVAADPNFHWAGPSHLLIENSCITCHMYMRDYISSTEPKISGHTFEPKVEACARCHGTINDFEDIPASADFDGDGIVEGFENEVEGLVDLLVDALVADGLDTTGVGIEGALGDTTKSTYAQRESGFNLVMVESDGSHGFHNPDYVVQLLQQSIMHISPLPPNAVIVKNDNEAVSNW